MASDPTQKTQNGNGKAVPADKPSLSAFYGFLQQALT
jgi:hypothetical protein